MHAPDVVPELGVDRRVARVEGTQQHALDLLVVATVERLETRERTGQQERVGALPASCAVGQHLDTARQRLQGGIVVPERLCDRQPLHVPYPRHGCRLTSSRRASTPRERPTKYQRFRPPTPAGFAATGGNATTGSRRRESDVPFGVKACA